MFHPHGGLELPGAFLKAHDPVFPHAVGHGETVRVPAAAARRAVGGAGVPSGVDLSAGLGKAEGPAETEEVPEGTESVSPLAGVESAAMCLSFRDKLCTGSPRRASQEAVRVFTVRQRQGAGS